jgi:hypothetical protein
LVTGIPAWLGASAGHGAQAGQVNQFLGGHNSVWLYAGTQRAAQTTGTGIYQSTQSQWLAQQFTTAPGQTQIGAVWLQISAVGGSPASATIPPLTVSLYISSGGLPLGPALALTSTAEQVVYSAGFWLRVPLPATVTPLTVYQLVVSSAGATGHYYVWQQSNQVSGASASPDGITWSAQPFGLMFQVLDQTGGGPPQTLYDDNGARVTQFSYNAQNLVASITESVLAQDGSVATFTRGFTYTNGTLTGVA